jgi:dATP pyrophosphohydrolase
MVRTPFKVLVLPFHRSPSGCIEYAIFKKGEDYWQGIAGGVEEGETFTEAAKREAWEEGRIPGTASFIPLDTVASFSFDNRLITQYAFAVVLQKKYVRLSDEHTEYRWLSYEQALGLLKWDSDKAALRELNDKLSTDRRDGGAGRIP